MWICRADIAKRGFRPATARLWAGETPSETEAAEIASQCNRLQNEMLVWSRDEISPTFDGTLGSLVKQYETDPDSLYQKLRYRVKIQTSKNLARLRADCGARALRALTGRDLMRWYDGYADAGPENPRKLHMAHEMLSLVRRVIHFGVTIAEPDTPLAADCARLSIIMEKLRFENGAPRTDQLTADMATAIRAKAHELGHHSVALAQALQFELTLRQRDVIGEWVPMSETGISDVIWRGQKWLRGVRWEEISPDMILTHNTSKTGANAVFDLSLYPMVLEEIARTPAELREGPMVVREPGVRRRESAGKPWDAAGFRRVWREIADAAGLPRSIKNMDSRAGGVTESTDAGAAIEDVRHHATHKNASTTQRYSRGTLEKTSKVAKLRVEYRGKPK